MRNSMIVFFLLMLPSFVLAGDKWVTTATTPGTGRLEIVTNYIVFSSGTSYDVRIPRRIDEGTRIQVTYNEDGTWIKREFDVAGISAKGDLCRLRNKLPSQYSSSPGDTIYVKPCRYQ